MLLAVTGLAREARILSRPHLAVAVGGGNVATLQARIAHAVEAGAKRIISIGVCGALCPTLAVGDCVVATEIVTEEERLDTHRRWSEELLGRLPQARPATLAGTDVILKSPESKRSLRERTGADAADMESHIAARLARQRGLPFAAMRIVSDDSRQCLPPAALVAMSANGRINLLAVLRSLFANPGQIPALLRTAWEAERAFDALFRCRHVLDPLPVAVDLGKLSLDVG